MDYRIAITIYFIIIILSGIMMIVLQATGGLPWIMLLPVISCASSIYQYRKICN